MTMVADKLQGAKQLGIPGTEEYQKKDEPLKRPENIKEAREFLRNPKSGCTWHTDHDGPFDEEVVKAWVTNKAEQKRIQKFQILIDTKESQEDQDQSILELAQEIYDWRYMVNPDIDNYAGED